MTEGLNKEALLARIKRDTEQIALLQQQLNQLEKNRDIHLGIWWEMVHGLHKEDNVKLKENIHGLFHLSYDNDMVGHLFPKGEIFRIESFDDTETFLLWNYDGHIENVTPDKVQKL